MAASSSSSVCSGPEFISSCSQLGTDSAALTMAGLRGRTSQGAGYLDGGEKAEQAWVGGRKQVSIGLNA